MFRNGNRLKIDSIIRSLLEVNGGAYSLLIRAAKTVRCARPMFLCHLTSSQLISLTFNSVIS